MNTKTIWIIIAALILIIGAGWYISTQNAPAPVPAAGEVQSNEEEFIDDSKDGAAAGVTVVYGANGFSPSTVTVKRGTAVTFVNQGGEEMWVGSDEHPSHTQYAGTSKDEHCTNGPSTTSFDQCGVSPSYTFTFNKTGSWGYHNHRESDDHGTVVVTE